MITDTRSTLLTLTLSIGSGVVFWLLAHYYLKAREDRARNGAWMTAMIVLVARLTHPFWPSPLPLDFDDIHTASMVVAGAASGLLSAFYLKTRVTKAVLVAVLATFLNFLLFVAVGFLFLAFS